jgi:NADH:ubiquinone oxidoreductase subunit C
MWEGFEGWPLRKDYPLLGNTPGTPGHVGKGGKR